MLSSNDAELSPPIRSKAPDDVEVGGALVVGGALEERPSKSASAGAGLGGPKKKSVQNVNYMQ